MLEQVEPWGDRRLDLLFARLSALVANVWTSKRAEPFTAKDFLPAWEEHWKAVLTPESTELSPEEESERTVALAGKIVAINTWFGGTETQ